jgi:hypothetical protein
MALNFTINVYAIGASFAVLLTFWDVLSRADGKIDTRFYVACGMFGLIVIWQFISMLFSANLMSKMRRIPSKVHTTAEEKNAELTNSETRDYLPPADLQNVIPSVVEVTTKNLSKVGRK